MAKKDFPEFNKITLQDMIDYIEENAPEDKAWFKEKAFDTRVAKRRVPVYNADGTPATKISKKTGKVIPKTQMEDVPGGKKSSVFNLLKAKRAFCKRYMPHLLPVANPKAPKASDLLKGW